MENNNYTKFFLDETEYETTLPKKFQNRKAFERANNKKINAFIPGLIVSVNIEKGKKIKSGESLLVLEAMKMKNDVVSHIDGVVKEVAVQKGTVVTKGQLLLELE